MFVKKWNDNQKPTKNLKLRTTLRKGSSERTGGTVKWHSFRLQYVAQVGLGQGGLHTGWDRMGLGQGGLQIRRDRMGLRQVSLQIRWDRMGLGGSSS